MKLLIHSQTSILQPLKFGNCYAILILRIIMDVITYPYWDWSLETMLVNGTRWFAPTILCWLKEIKRVWPTEAWTRRHFTQTQYLDRMVLYVRLFIEMCSICPLDSTPSTVPVIARCRPADNRPHSVIFMRPILHHYYKKNESLGKSSLL